MMRINCRTNVYQMHDFFLKYHGTTYYLFTQKFRRGVDNYYSNGVLLDKAIDHSQVKVIAQFIVPWRNSECS